MSGIAINGGGPAVGTVLFVEGDTGGPIGPNGAGIIFLTGGTSGLVFNGTTNTETLAVNFDGVALTTANVVTETGNTLGTAAITGGTNVTIDATSTPNQIIINASGGSGIQTLTGNDSVAVGPTGGGNVNLVGDGTSISITNTSANTLTAAFIGTSGITTIDGDSGATGSSTTPKIYSDVAALNSGCTVAFVGDNTSKLTFNVTDSQSNTIIGQGSGRTPIGALFGASYNVGLGANVFTGLNDANYNVAIGYNVSNVLNMGCNNTIAIGANVLNSYNGGDAPSFIAIGSSCLTNQIDATGNGNIAIGLSALTSSTYSSGQIAIGESALISATTSSSTQNVAIGMSAGGALTTGAYNVLIGSAAGGTYSTVESSNICLNSAGVVLDENTLRIGNATGSGAQDLAKAYICGIDGVALTTANVVTETGDQLGTAVITGGSGITVDGTSTPNEIIISLTPSSERFKQNIQPLTDSSAVLNLKPVTFEYKPNLANISKTDATGTHYGLIAEDVQKVLPNLTFNDNKGNVQGVRYMEMIPLLLNEIQKLRKEVDALKKGK